MVLTITKKQEQAYLAIKSNPNSDKIKLIVLLGLSNRSVAKLLETMLKKGIITRKKGALSFEYTAVDIEYNVKANAEVKHRTDNKKVHEIILPADDELLRSAIAFEFTKEQIKFIKANKGMTRSQLAKKLGIDKLEFNQALHRLNNKINS